MKKKNIIKKNIQNCFWRKNSSQNFGLKNSIILKFASPIPHFLFHLEGRNILKVFLSFPAFWKWKRKEIWDYMNYDREFLPLTMGSCESLDMSAIILHLRGGDFFLITASNCLVTWSCLGCPFHIFILPSVIACYSGPDLNGSPFKGNPRRWSW